jgi:FMN-dependent NADH-azoreductase
MPDILYIKASPRGGRSHSIFAADAFLDALRKKHAVLDVDEWDLFADEPPRFGAPAAEGKYAVMSGRDAPAGARDAWGRVERAIERFSAPSTYLLAVPMWNFGIPYVFKQLIDCVVQPGYTFSVGAGGYAGLLQDRKAVVAYASGGQYDAMPEMDRQKPYVRQILQFMGIKEQHEIVVAPTMGDEDAVRAVRRDAQAEAERLAAL